VQREVETISMPGMRRVVAARASSLNGEEMEGCGRDSTRKRRKKMGYTK
jgi:hypothetical protein